MEIAGKSLKEMDRHNYANWETRSSLPESKPARTKTSLWVFRPTLQTAR